MASTGAFLGAGLLAGFGKGVMDLALEEARSQKELTLRKLDQEFRSGEAEKAREHTSSEAVATREHQAQQGLLSRQHAETLADKNITARAEEGDKTREHAAGLMSNQKTQTDREGRVWMFGADGQAKPVMDASGNHLTAKNATANRYTNVIIKDDDGNDTYGKFDRTSGDITPTGVKAGTRPNSASRAPAEVQSAEWLAKVTAGAEGREVTDQDRKAAMAEIRQAKTSPAARADLVVRAYKMAKDDITDERPDAEKKSEAKKMIDDLLGPAAPSSAAPPAGKSAKPEASAKPPAGLQGAGTREAPYAPASQAQIDWIKKNAPAGAVISINGKLMRKQ